MQAFKDKVISGVLWRFSESFAVQVVTFMVSIVLARQLGPEAFGTVALLNIFLALSTSLINSGFATALIQKHDVDELDLNSVFITSLCISAALYAILWFSAPVIAAFFKTPILVSVLRVLAIRLFFDAVNGVQNAVLSRKMLFNRSFWITLSGAVSSGVVGIYMAYTGYGLWALVWSSLSGGFVATCVRWLMIGWRPQMRFSRERLSALFGYGSKMLASGLIDTFFSQIYGLVVGKWYSVEELAYFNRGEHIPQMAMNGIQGSIGSVVFPAFSQMQYDRARLKRAMKRVMQTSSFVIFPVMFGLASISAPLVKLLLSDKWMPSVPFMQMACLGYAFWPIHVANLQAIQALGRSDIFLRLEIIKKSLLVILLLLTFSHGVFVMACGKMLLTPISIVINSIPNKKLLDYSTSNQLRDILPVLGLSIITALAMLSASFFFHNPVILLIVEIPIGALVYCTGAFVLGLPAWKEFFAMLRPVFYNVMLRRK